MPTQLPAHTRPASPCPVVERMFATVERLCPYPEMLIDEARAIATCPVGGAIQKRRAESLMRSVVAMLTGPDFSVRTIKEMAPTRAAVAFAQTLLTHERWQDAVAVAVEVLAESVELRRGNEEGRRELWEAIVTQVGGVRGLGA